MKKTVLLFVFILVGFLLKAQSYEFDAGYRGPDGNNHYYKLATLPTSNSSTADYLKIELNGGYWISNYKYIKEILFSNRGGFKAVLLEEKGYSGSSAGTQIEAYSQADGSVYVYLVLKNGYYHGFIQSIATNYINPIFNNNPTREYSAIGTKIFDSSTAIPSYKTDLNNNVGINTRKLTPNSKLTVAGKISCQEAGVTIDAGADFVFEENYPIRTIEEVESFVKKNKHLPEIEPAVEMEANGIDLGKMNIKLLQKIEELTLYLIEQNKRQKKLINEIDELKQKTNELEILINSLKLE